VALTIAAACFTVFILVYSGLVAPSSVPKWFASSVYGCYQWLAMVAVLGFARRHLTADGPVRRYLTDAIFPCYIVHQTAIIVIAHALQGSGLSAGSEAAIVISGTALTCFATYEIARRIGWLRPLFGLRTEPRSAAGMARQQPA
jgi:hypothetical protein